MSINKKNSSNKKDNLKKIDDIFKHIYTKYPQNPENATIKHAEIIIFRKYEIDKIH